MPANKIAQWTNAGQNIALDKGEEMGRFLLASTLVKLLPQHTVAFSRVGTRKLLLLGETLGDLPVFDASSTCMRFSDEPVALL